MYEKWKSGHDYEFFVSSVFEELGDFCVSLLIRLETSRLKDGKREDRVVGVYSCQEVAVPVCASSP